MTILLVHLFGIQRLSDPFIDNKQINKLSCLDVTEHRIDYETTKGEVQISLAKEKRTGIKCAEK